ncbi:Phage protein [Bacillus sp. ZZV12-4809]|nr:Phage protein [Bacillus sp. ZZV12-4809]
MLKGKYIGSDKVCSLNKEYTYFLFPNGPNHYYVSRFNNPNAHFGCFDCDWFHILEEEDYASEPPRTNIDLEQGKIYKAKLFWRRAGYCNILLTHYYLLPQITHAHFYEDIELTKCKGCFPLHWFKDFKEVSYIIEETGSNHSPFTFSIASEESSDITFKQLTLF